MSEETSHSAYRREFTALLLVAKIAILVRLALLLFAHASSGASYAQIISGHDAVEYFAFADSLASFELQELHSDIRRHNVGWPLIIALVSWAGPEWIMSLAVMLASIAGSVFLVRSFYTSDESRATLVLVAAATVLAYPSFLYFHIFAMSEPLFVFCLLGAYGAYMKQKRLVAYALCGMAGLIRPPGLALAVAFAVADALQGHGIRQIGKFGLSVVPLCIWLLVSRHVWGNSNIEIHGPKMGLPFSGFAGAAETGTIRAVYVFGAVLFFLCTTVMFVRTAHKRQWKDSSANIFAVFAVLFLTFHLCLKSLHYMGRDVWTFNYQDRYLVGMLPFSVFAVRRWLSWPLVLLLAIASIGLSLYWTKNYLLAAGIS